MPQLHDLAWQVTEQEREQYNAFDLKGSKGIVNWYPTIELKFPEEFYSREEALLNATVAASAPSMLRLLEQLEEVFEKRLLDWQEMSRWKKRIRKEIAEAKGEIERT